MARYMRAVYGTDQLDVYTPVEAAAIQSDTSCPLLKSVSLRGNPKESVKHKSNNNGCVWRGDIVIVVFVSLP